MLWQDLCYSQEHIEEHIGLWQELWHPHKASPAARERMGKLAVVPKVLTLLMRKTGSSTGFFALMRIYRLRL